jgi:dihydroorotate dehydrogenase electron transfer subunit
MAPLTTKERPREWAAIVATNRERGGGFHQLSLALLSHFPIPRAGAFLMVSVGAEPAILLRRPMVVYDALEIRNQVRVEILYSVVGRGTQQMLSLQPDQEISLLGPLGNSFSQPNEAENVAIVAGGVGVAPFLLWGRQLLPFRRKNVRLFFGFSNREQLSIVRDFSRVHLKPLSAVEGPGGDFCGTVVEMFQRETETVPLDRILTCGPEKMMEKVATIAAERQIPCEASLEAKMGCGLGLCLSCVTSTGGGIHAGGYALVCRDGPIFVR